MKMSHKCDSALAVSAMQVCEAKRPERVTRPRSIAPGVLPADRIWAECDELLQALGLLLPTRAQEMVRSRRAHRRVLGDTCRLRLAS